jgi:hypothetical protein
LAKDENQFLPLERFPSFAQEYFTSKFGQ